MLNLFLQNLLLKQGLSAVLLITTIFLAGGSIFFYLKPTQVSALTTFDIPQIVNTVWEVIADIWVIIEETAGTAYNALSAAYDQWMKSESILAQATRIAAQVALYQILNMLTNQIIEWIQGGGEPKFITDWGGFLQDAADKAGGKFVSDYLGMGWLCESFDLDIKIALLDVPTFEDRVKCTLSDMVANISDFANDFNNGGWTGWLSLTEPQNNFYSDYFIAKNEKLKSEAEALQAAIQETSVGSGFLSPKVCVKGHVSTGNKETCNDKDSCDDLKQVDVTFVCDKEIISTPASVLSEMTNKVVNQPLELIQAQMADLADSLGPLGPYIVAIGNALTNRVIKEGLAYIDSLGPTPDKPDLPPPPGTPLPPIDRTPAQATVDEGNASTLIPQQELLKENIKDLYLPQQQSNLSVMLSIKSIQDNILNSLADAFESGCSLPSWATITYNTETTLEITANNIGRITIKKTIIEDPDSEDNSATISYSTEKIEAQIDSQIAIMREEINKTNQWIAEITTAVASTKGFVKTISEYLELYQNTLQPPTAEEQAALDEKKQSMLASKDLVIASAQKIADSTSNNLNDLEADTRKINMKTIEKTNNLLMARGLDEQYFQAGTLYAQKQDLISKQSGINFSCNDNNDGD
ncbi:hypothetical protein KKD72_03150 [Patescibacteria group bacterium]|nr:hypothetical protein [Patescibacteria group bacterium]